MTRSRGILIGFTLLILSVAIVYITYVFVSFWMSPATPGPSRSVFYEVKKNESPLYIAEQLEKIGAVKNAKLFYWYGRFTGRNHKFKAADYRFFTSMKPDDVMNVLMSGVSYGINITIPEGANFRQIAAILEGVRLGSGQEFIKLVQSQVFIRSLGIDMPLSKTLEGYLFPDTYTIGRKSPIQDLVKTMVKHTQSIFTPEIDLRMHEIGFTEYQVLTLASVIEKETGSGKERPVISSVFHNRLKKRMKLQSDPTVIYGIPDYDGNIHKSDLTRRTPYNTYVIYGLPLGPIANPGKDAIMAALFPEDTPYFYFVSHNDGTHEFTSTYADHKKAVEKFQLDRHAREGKSWRDLNKRNNQN